MPTFFPLCEESHALTRLLGRITGKPLHSGSMEGPKEEIEAASYNDRSLVIRLCSNKVLIFDGGLWSIGQNNPEVITLSKNTPNYRLVHHDPDGLLYFIPLL